MILSITLAFIFSIALICVSLSLSEFISASSTPYPRCTDPTHLLPCTFNCRSYEVAPLTSPCTSNCRYKFWKIYIPSKKLSPFFLTVLHWGCVWYNLLEIEIESSCSDYLWLCEQLNAQVFVINPKKTWNYCRRRFKKKE